MDDLPAYAESIEYVVRFESATIVLTASSAEPSTAYDVLLNIGGPAYLPSLAYNPSGHNYLPSSLPHAVRVLIMSYARAITSTSTGFVVTQEDVDITTHIQARMEQFGGSMENWLFLDLDEETWAMDGPSVSFKIPCQC